MTATGGTSPTFEVQVRAAREGRPIASHATGRTAADAADAVVERIGVS